MNEQRLNTEYLAENLRVVLHDLERYSPQELFLILTRLAATIVPETKPILSNETALYYEVMDCLREMELPHGRCHPREDKACSHCNAEDRLIELRNNYRGRPIVAQQMQGIGAVVNVESVAFEGRCSQDCHAKLSPSKSICHNSVCPLRMLAATQAAEG